MDSPGSGASVVTVGRSRAPRRRRTGSVAASRPRRVGAGAAGERELAAAVGGYSSAWFAAWAGDLRRSGPFRNAQAREGRMLPWLVFYDDGSDTSRPQLAGQLTVSGIVGGSASWGQIGYWVDQRLAGRGIIPTAVALAVDYCFQVMSAAPDRDRHPAREHQEPAGGGQAGFPPRGAAAALSAHRR